MAYEPIACENCGRELVRYIGLLADGIEYYKCTGCGFTWAVDDDCEEVADHG